MKEFEFLKVETEMDGDKIIGRAAGLTPGGKAHGRAIFSPGCTGVRVSP